MSETKTGDLSAREQFDVEKNIDLSPRDPRAIKLAKPIPGTESNGWCLMTEASGRGLD